MKTRIVFSRWQEVATNTHVQFSYERNILLDVLLEVEWMVCELLCEAATVAKLPALVVAM